LEKLVFDIGNIDNVLSLRQIRDFLAAAEKGQVSQAAASLNVSQSTVTAALQQLELDLGVSLFRRLPSGVELTLEGSRFLTHATLWRQ
jgi:DNA-binding transcriptional LysR family regulator